MIANISFNDYHSSIKFERVCCFQLTLHLKMEHFVSQNQMTINQRLFCTKIFNIVSHLV